MTNKNFFRFVDEILDRQCITAKDVAHIQRDILPDGITCREEADVLIALDRAVKHQDASFADCLVAMLVDFVVWGERPTGIVRGEDAHWLVTSLGAGGGPTVNALRVGMEIVREAQQVDEVLLAFLLRGQGNRLRRALGEPARPMPRRFAAA